MLRALINEFPIYKIEMVAYTPQGCCKKYLCKRCGHGKLCLMAVTFLLWFSIYTFFKANNIFKNMIYKKKS